MRLRHPLFFAADPAEWFRQPTEGVTHIAWQVGHLALAEYWLTLERIRGRRPDDLHLAWAAGARAAVLTPR